jgi:hypothetical protein
MATTDASSSRRLPFKLISLQGFWFVCSCGVVAFAVLHAASLF